jgi:HAD superfamily hydrolase (TIGR01450 family)
MTSRDRYVYELSHAVAPLIDGYDVVMFDLDGVLYLGTEPVSYASDGVEQVRAAGSSVAFVTNNASRTPEEVAAQLQAVGVSADSSDVVTSAQAAARLVAGQVPAAAAVLVVGGAGLEAALCEHGLRPVRRMTDEPAAVIQGYSPEVTYSDLAEAGYAVASGLPWVASNTDLTIPTSRGIAPGNGTLVAAVAAASGQRPQVAGKPEPPLFDETVLRVGGHRPLVVGDRLDTDIEGANRVGADSLLVLTGVTDASALCNAHPVRRPTFVGADLRALSASQPAVTAHSDHDVGPSWRCGGWRAAVTPAGSLEVVAESESGAALESGVSASCDSMIALLRAGVAAAWAWRDGRPSPPDVDASALAEALAGQSLS